MVNHLRANILLLVSTFVICSIVYPLAVLAVGQGLVPRWASGDIVTRADGSPVGARLIAQEFKGDEWFQPRPSNVVYTANSSGGSNLGASNPKLRERVEETLKARSQQSDVPADAVTTSGSGLDPHITLKNARGQLDRVAGAWASKKGGDLAQVRGTLEGVLNAAAVTPMFGLVGGEPLVNVLEVNLEVAKRLGS